MTNRAYLFDELMDEDALLIGRQAFLEKYGLDKEAIYDKVNGEYIREITKKSLRASQWELIQMKRITIKEWRAMSKIKSWLMDMEEDATIMSRGSWLEKHGKDKEYIFERIQAELAEVQGELELHTQNKIHTND